VSLFSRITGLLDSFQKIELDERDRYGAGGEDEVETILKRGRWRYMRSPLVPHPSKPGVFLEGDFLVHSGNALVVLEVKKLIGRLAFQDADQKLLAQVKEGRYGEGLFVKHFGNPLSKTNNFAFRLRSYLTNVDPRFKSVHIDAAVVFAPTADISAIHNPNAMIHTTELADLLRRKGASNGADRRWVVDALMYVPTWDRLETSQGDSIYGLFLSPSLEFRDSSGRRQTVPFRDVREIAIQAGGFLADASRATITTNRRQVVRTAIAHGEIALDRFGTVQRHKLRNLTRIVPGIARMRHQLAAVPEEPHRGSKMPSHAPAHHH
jgi:Nuclease-related domain